MTEERRGATYDRDVLTTVLIYHARTDTSGCHCGWAVLGASYADHVAAREDMSVKDLSVKGACRVIIETDSPVSETLDACIEIAERIDQGHVRWSDSTTLLAHLRVLREDLALTPQEVWS